jgi:hypothetical protein
MGKPVRIFKSHEESERYMLEQSLARTPEERILWLLKQNEIMYQMNPVKKKSKGLALKRKHG